MSSHSYRTTTVDYYEYLTPDAHDYESIAWPFQAAISENDVSNPLDYFRYLSELQGNLAMSGGNNQETALIYDVAPFQLLPFFEFSEQRPHQEQERVQQRHCFNAQNSRTQQNPAEPVAEREFNYNTENFLAPLSKPKSKKKNVYQAEQGYIVEEPTSESDEEPENTS